MRNLANILLFFLFTTPTTAEIKSVKIRSDNREAILFETFEFTKNGHVSISVSSVSITSSPVNSSLSPPADLSRIGFFLDSENSPFFYMQSSCELDSNLISVLFTFQDLSPPSNSSFNKSYLVTVPDWYSLRFANCNPLSRVTMDVRTEFYNTYNGNTKDYLSASITKLPSLYSIFSLIYLCFLGFWTLLCIKNQSSFHWFHLLIGVLFLTKGLYMLCAAKVEYVLKVTGTRPHGWDVLFYICQFYGVVLLCTVIPVSYRKQVLMVVIPLQVLSTVFSQVIRESSPVYIDSDGLGFLFFLVNSIRSFVICFSMLQLVCKPDEGDSNYSKKIMVLHIVGAAYLLIDLLLVIPVTYGNHWGYNAANEIVSLVFYMVIFYVFRPLFEKNGYLPVKL